MEWSTGVMEYWSVERNYPIFNPILHYSITPIESSTIL
jgi:hypothetical protein